MKNFIQSGKLIDVTMPYAVSSGGGAKIGYIFGIATDTYGSGAAGELMIEGVFDLAKDTSVFSAGDKIYWDDTNKVASSTAQGNMQIGRATLAALTGDATVRTLLTEGIPTVFLAFQSTEATGTGSSQNVAHGLGVVPPIVAIVPTDTSPSTAGVFTVTMGTHDATNIKVTVTSGKKFMAYAWA